MIVASEAETGTFSSLYKTKARRTSPNLAYLEQKLGIGSMAVLKRRLLAQCQDLDLDQLADDVRPFLYQSDAVDKVTSFNDYVARSL